MKTKLKTGHIANHSTLLLFVFLTRTCSASTTCAALSKRLVDEGDVGGIRIEEKLNKSGGGGGGGGGGNAIGGGDATIDILFVKVLNSSSATAYDSLSLEKGVEVFVVVVIVVVLLMIDVGFEFFGLNTADVAFDLGLEGIA
uniref:Uncharacterized protein n=1 Tax=Glossina brevipalpis TaxID=37001 RepID=A0A1A9W3G5_9MUSC